MPRYEVRVRVEGRQEYVHEYNRHVVVEAGSAEEALAKAEDVVGAEIEGEDFDPGDCVDVDDGIIVFSRDSVAAESATPVPDNPALAAVDKLTRELNARREKLGLPRLVEEDDTDGD